MVMEREGREESESCSPPALIPRAPLNLRLVRNRWNRDDDGCRFRRLKIKKPVRLLEAHLPPLAPRARATRGVRVPVLLGRRAAGRGTAARSVPGVAAVGAGVGGGVGIAVVVVSLRGIRSRGDVGGVASVAGVAGNLHIRSRMLSIKEAPRPARVHDVDDAHGGAFDTAGEWQRDVHSVVCLWPSALQLLLLEFEGCPELAGERIADGTKALTGLVGEEGIGAWNAGCCVVVESFARVGGVDGLVVNLWARHGEG